MRSYQNRSKSFFDPPAAEGSLRFQISLQSQTGKIMKQEPDQVVSMVMPKQSRSSSTLSAAAADAEAGGAGVRSMAGGKNKKKFVGVRQRPSGRWVAEIKDTTQKIRLWLGTFNTAEDAARAYDEAACLLRGTNTRTNFVNSSSNSASDASALPSKAAKMLLFHRGSSAAVNASGSSAAEKLLDFSRPKRTVVGNQKTSTLNSSSCKANNGFLASEDHQNNDFSAGFGNSGLSWDHQLPTPVHEEERRLKRQRSESFGSSSSTGFMEASEITTNMAESAFDIYSGFHQAFEDIPLTAAASNDLSSSISSSSVPEEELVVLDHHHQQQQLQDDGIIHHHQLDNAGGAVEEQMRRIRYERQSSASLYLMNGVQECLMLGAANSALMSSPSLSLPPSFHAQRASAWNQQQLEQQPQLQQDQNHQDDATEDGSLDAAGQIQDCLWDLAPLCTVN